MTSADKHSRDGSEEPRYQFSVIGGLVLLFIRGFALWIVVPLALLVWPFLALWLRKKNVGVGQYLGWVDTNLIVLIQRTLISPLGRRGLPWSPPRAIGATTHRISLIDPA